MLLKHLFDSIVDNLFEKSDTNLNLGEISLFLIDKVDPFKKWGYNKQNVSLFLKSFGNQLISSLQKYKSTEDNYMIKVKKKKKIAKKKKETNKK